MNREFAAALAVILICTIAAFGHCDTMDGPVVKAAQTALRTGNVNYVLIWVHNTEEAEVIRTFKQAIRVRKLGRDAQTLADRYFFETVVRLHRAGEGEPYTGLKPSGTEEAKLFVEIDRAIDKGSLASLINKFTEGERQEIEGRFRDVMAKKKFSVNDVKAGRQYVETYVTFLHFVEKAQGIAES